MPITQTSREAYNRVSSHITASQAAVWRMLRRSMGGLTNMEIADMLEWSINRVTPRINELVKLGFVVNAGRRQCRVTGGSAEVRVAVDDNPQMRLF